VDLRRDAGNVPCVREHPNRATDAPYTVQDGTTALATVRVDQEREPDDRFAHSWWWEDLGTFTVTGDTLTVKLTNEADEHVIADAVRIERV
jgi:hypothetical protein